MTDRLRDGTDTDPAGRENLLVERAEELRREAPRNGFLEIVNLLREEVGQLSAQDLLCLQERLPRYFAPSTPSAVAEMLLALMEGRKPGTLLDPCGGTGLLAARLAEALPHWQVDVVPATPESQDLLRPVGLPNLRVGTGCSMASPYYDAILSVLPCGQPARKRSFAIGDKQVELTDEPGLLSIVEAASRLADKAFVAVVVPPKFIWDNRATSVRRNLHHFGLHLSALLRFRPGTFVETSVGFELALMSRNPNDAVFVAEVPADADAQRALVTRLRKRKQGRTPSQGRLVQPDQYHGLEALEARERYEKLAKGKGLGFVPFEMAVPRIVRPRRKGKDFERCDEHPAAVYLPEMASTAATTRQSDLPPGLKSYFQLLVDPNVVLPEYLAGLLNTPMGQSLRRSAMTGVALRRINKTLLNASALYLPSVEEQRQALGAEREIQRLRDELSELQAKLWDQPQQAASIAAAVSQVNHEDRFSDWVETLPFPLASILRSYHALDHTPKEKYERLLHFFEAVTVFLAVIHLSAFRSRGVLWEEKKAEIAEVLRAHHLSLERASFGAWRAITELMASNLRQALGDKDKAMWACSVYNVADTTPLEMLASADLVGVLQRVNGFRNRWTGHGGAVTQEEAAHRHALLEDDLTKVRGVIGRRFFQWQLIEPQSAEILDGPVFRCRLRRVMGSNPQLEHGTVDLVTPAKSGRLYLHHEGHDQALELIPLIQVRDAPQPASYFYNRVESNGAHFVSYHFAAQSEIADDGASLLPVLQAFR